MTKIVVDIYKTGSTRVRMAQYYTSADNISRTAIRMKSKGRGSIAVHAMKKEGQGGGPKKAWSLEQEVKKKAGREKGD